MGPKSVWFCDGISHCTKISLILNLESQIPTQRYGRRPFGVGLLVAGYDVSVHRSIDGIPFF